MDHSKSNTWIPVSVMNRLYLPCKDMNRISHGPHGPLLITLVITCAQAAITVGVCYVNVRKTSYINSVKSLKIGSAIIQNELTYFKTFVDWDHIKIPP